jgi:hypothetical protein
MNPLLSLGVLLFAGWGQLPETIVVEQKEPLAAALNSGQTLKFERDSLEQALMALAKKVQAKQPDFAIEILGNDLRLEGITKNQSIRDFSAEGKTVAEILTALVLQANPNSAVKDPRDPKLQLLWIVGQNPKNEKQTVVLITTRAAASKRGDKLPAMFQEK